MHPSPARNEEALAHAQRVLDHRLMLQPGEVVHETGPAAHFQIPGYAGASVGILLISSTRVVWARHGAAGGYAWPREDIRAAETRQYPRSLLSSAGRQQRVPRRVRRGFQILHLELEPRGGQRRLEVELMGEPGFLETVARLLNGDNAALSVRLWRAEVGNPGQCTTFAVVVSAGGGDPTVIWALDPELQYEVGDPKLMATDMLVQQAHGDLLVSLGREPQLPHRPRPDGFMPEFRWEPPLPSAP